MTVRFETTPNGEIAILPRDEYESLVARAADADEDVGIARLVDIGRREVAMGGPVLPKAVVDRLANGESALRVMREWRGETQLHLEFLTGIGQSHISDIETGRRTGTAETLRKLADALGVPLDLLV